MSESTTWAVIIFLWLLTFAISWWNSYVVGRLCPHTKIEGGWQHWLTWMGYVQAIFGFAWCCLIPLTLVAYTQHWFGFGAKELNVALKLGYLTIGGALIFSGLFIWLESLRHAWRERTLGSGAVATWNTYAQLSNMYDYAVNAKSFGTEVMDYFSDAFGGDSDSDSGPATLAVVVIVFVVVSVLAGFVLASAISTASMRSESRQFRSELRAASERAGAK